MRPGSIRSNACPALKAGALSAGQQLAWLASNSATASRQLVRLPGPRAVRFHHDIIGGFLGSFIGLGKVESFDLGGPSAQSSS
jgi:hypothetical protein